MKIEKEQYILYAVTDRRWLKDGETLADEVEKAIRGGAGIIQLREKHLNEDDFIAEARQILAVCRKYRAPLIINDNVRVAIAVGADGVHVGQSDLDAADVRSLLGDEKILGVSAHSVEEALRAERAGADYLGVGAAFATGSKEDVHVLSHAVYREICAQVHIPVVAIGGITADNIAELAGSGISGAAVISAVFAADDTEAAARLMKERIAAAVAGERKGSTA